MIWGGNPRSFPPAFSIKGYEVGGHAVLFSPVRPVHVLVVGVADGRRSSLLFRRTTSACGCARRRSRPRSRGCSACASAGCSPSAGRWPSLAGSLAGVLVAPSVFVAPNSFDAVLVFGFTAAVIGGLDSPLGALVGGVAARARAELRLGLRAAPSSSRSARW